MKPSERAPTKKEEAAHVGEPEAEEARGGKGRLCENSDAPASTAEGLRADHRRLCCGARLQTAAVFLCAASFPVKLTGHARARHEEVTEAFYTKCF